MAGHTFNLKREILVNTTHFSPYYWEVGTCPLPRWSQDNCWSGFSPSTRWVVGIELGSSDLVPVPDVLSHLTDTALLSFSSFPLLDSLIY